MKYAIIVLVVVALSLTAKAQTVNASQVPASVNTTFTTQFPNASNLSWEMQNGTNYYVTFGQSGTQYTALFDPKGTWLETGTEIPSAQLPSMVNQSIAKQYAGYTISHVNSLKQKDSDMIYQIKLKKGTQEKEIFLNSKGEVTSRKYARMDKMEKMPNK